jgi:hypothetical protein
MDAKKILARRSNDNVTHLFKGFLKILEDLKRDHDDSYRKLRQNIPQEYSGVLNMGDYFDDNKMSWLRKRILDLGNETLRSNDSELNNFTVSFTFKN